MSVYRRPDGKTYTYDFWQRGIRYRGSTGQLRKEDAERWEKKYQLRLAQEAGGVAPFDVEHTPTFHDWAHVYYREAAKTLKRPERVEFLLRCVLRFWGRRPGPGSKVPIDEKAPYHDLRLGHPILDPQWIVRFERWMDGRKRAGQTKNQYRSTCSQLYVLAQRPEWRGQTGIVTNPFVGLARDPQRRRTVALTADQVRALLTHARYHVRLAIAIGALAPKLRLENILSLEWRRHLDPALAWITVHDHKTDRKTARPLVVPISAQLRAILEDAKTRRPKAKYVVMYRGDRVHSLRGGLAGAATRAGLPYGRFTEQGLTFHTLRHTAATLMAELAIGPDQRQDVMGHQTVEMTRHYTHLRPAAERAPLEQLSAALPLVDLIVGSGVAQDFRGPRLAILGNRV